MVFICLEGLKALISCVNMQGSGIETTNTAVVSALTLMAQSTKAITNLISSTVSALSTGLLLKMNNSYMYMKGIGEMER